MSIRALNYARACLRHSCALPSGACRTVLLLLADSHNNRTGQAYTGMWLADQAGVDRRTMQRALHRLRDDGYIGLEERDGLASIVTFPIASYLSTARDTDDTGEQTRACDIEVPQPVTPTSPISLIPPDAEADQAFCCDGTGYVYDEQSRSVSPCPLHHPRAKKSQ